MQPLFKLTLGLWFATASQAHAACLSPYQTVFACDIADQNDRVEICAFHDNYRPDGMSYRFGPPDAEPELAFTTSGYYGSTKYDGFGIGLSNDSGYFYTIHARGSYRSGSIIAGLLEVYETYDDFLGGDELVQLNCRTETIEGDYRFFAP